MLTCNRIGTLLLILVWFGAVLGGFACLEDYDTRPGLQGTAIGDVTPSASGQQLSLYVHPHCPCARASLAELAELLSAAPVQARVVFVLPAGVPERWEQGELYRRAAALPSVQVELDRGGVEALRVGAATSGMAILTDDSGAIAFRGGITRARGRVGSAFGRGAILAILAGEVPEARTAAVFGCPLFDTPDEISNLCYGGLK